MTEIINNIIDLCKTSTPVNLKSLMNTIAADGNIYVDGYNPADTRKFYASTDYKSFCLTYSLETYEALAEDWYAKAICVYDYAVMTLGVEEEGKSNEYTLVFAHKDKLVVGLYYKYKFDSYHINREDNIYIVAVLKNMDVITEFDLKLLPKGCVKVGEYIRVNKRTKNDV